MERGVYTHIYSCCSVTKSCPALCNPMDTRLPCLSMSPEVCSNSCPLSQRCYLTITSSATQTYTHSLGSVSWRTLTKTAALLWDTHAAHTDSLT